MTGMSEATATDMPGISSAPMPFTGPELCGYPARTVIDLLVRREIAPHDLLDACEARVAAVEPAINALPITCFDRARGWPVAEQSLLRGLPIAIKDLTDIAGVRSTYGTPGLANNIPVTSDPLVERLEANGGIVVGHSNVPEFGAGGNTFNAVFGATRNPYDTRMNAGGSSGGAAAALAAGEVWLSHGSDLAGSLRTPAAYCGVVGLRPSPGRCGGGPAAAPYLTIGVQGPMARDVTDCALFLDAMVGADIRQPLSLPAPETGFRAALEGWEGDRPKLASLLDVPPLGLMEPVIRTGLEATLRLAERSGARISTPQPDLSALSHLFAVMRGHFFAALFGTMPDAIRGHFKPTLAQNIAFGEVLAITDIWEAERARGMLAAAIGAILSDADALVLPVVGLEPLPVEVEYPTAVAGVPMTDYIDWLRGSYLASVLGLPALVIPIGLSPSGLPMGIQLIGRPYGEAALLRVGRWLEACLDLCCRPIDPVQRH